MTSMRVLIAGHRGFVGKNLLARLTNFGHEVVGYDLGDEWPDGAGIQRVVNCAGVADVGKCRDHAAGAIRTNVELVARLLRIAPDVPFIQMSTAAVGRGDTSHYARTKRWAEELVAAEGGVIVRASNIFGPYSWHKSSVVPSFMRQAARGLELEVLANDDTRDFVYVGDVCDVILEALERRPAAAPILDATSGRQTSIVTLAELVGHIARGLEARDELEEQLQLTYDWFVGEHARLNEEKNDGG